MSIEEVTAAINCLQDPNQTKHANAWLEIFSRTTGAWQTLDLLLSQSCGPQKTFISISLYRKVQRDFYQIHSFSTPEALLQSLMQHMVRLATETPMDMVACRYICLSVAAAAVQSGIPGIVNKLLGWLNPLVSVCPMVLLELITALPQECYNNRISVSRDVQDKFSEELYQNLEEVCNFLYFILTNFNDQNKNTKAILQSFEVWVAHTTGPEGLLFSHPLFKFAIENLCNIDVLEFSSKIISSILLNDGIENKLISGALLQYVLQTRSLWLQYSALAKANSQNLDDFEDELSILRHISILVSDTASAFMAKVEDPDDETQVSLSTYILDCASFYWDFNIARIPFNYFYDLSLNYKERNGGISDSRIGQIFTSLLEISVRHMALPAGSIVSSEEVSDVDYEKRGELLDTIGDCMLVLGDHIFKIIFL